MATYEESSSLLKQFFNANELTDILEYKYHKDDGAVFSEPEEAKHVDFGFVSVRVCDDVNNTRILLNTLDAGKRRVLKSHANLMAEAENSNITLKVMDKLLSTELDRIIPYYAEVLSLLTLKLSLSIKQFDPLAQFTAGFIAKAKKVNSYVLEAYKQKAMEIKSKESESPDVNSYLEINQAKNRLLVELDTSVKTDINDFYNGVLKLLYDDCPTCLFAPTLIFDTVEARPYTNENLLTLVDSADREDIKKILYLDRYYGAELIPYLEELLFNDIIRHYARTESCTYSGKRLDFYNFYADKDVYSQAPLTKLFGKFFGELLRSRYEELLDDKSVKIKKSTSAEELFGDILKKAKACKGVSKALYKKLEATAEELTDILYEEKPSWFRRIFGK